MKPERFFLPLAVAAAIIGIWVAFRRTGENGSQVTVPNTASSGIPATYSAPGGGVQPVSYNVPATQINPSPTVVLSNPYDTNPGSVPAPSPGYLTHNFGPGHDLNKTQTSPDTSKSSCCGCGGGKAGCGACNGSSAFPDGNGTAPLVTSRAKLVNNSYPTVWMNSTVDNANSYLAGNAEPPVPTLTSQKSAAQLSSTPTLGSPGSFAPSPDLQQYLLPPFRSSGFAFQG